MMNKAKWMFPGALALAATLGTSAAYAGGPDVQWSITIGTPIVIGAPVPVYTYPAPVYRRAAPVYSPVRYRQPTAWDRDGDGIPNRHDRLYNPRWDVDGDGIPNRRDARYNPRWDRDGDGVPNRYDRYDHDPRRR
jgi:hypothetical protein